MKKLLSLAIAAAMALSCIGMASAVGTDEMSGLPGNGKITNFIQHVDLSAIQAAIPMEADEDIATVTEFTDSAIGGEGEYHFENIVFVRADIAAIADNTYVVVPANTAYYFQRTVVANAKMTVTYTPADDYLYFGLATNNNGTGRYITYQAQNGYGTASFAPPAVDYYYPYLGNPSDEPVIAYFNYTTL